MDLNEIESELDRHERAYRMICVANGIVSLFVIARACCLEL